MTTNSKRTICIACLVAAVAALGACESVKGAVEDGEISTEDLGGDSNGQASGSSEQSGGNSGGVLSSVGGVDPDSPRSTPKVIRKAYEEFTYEDCTRPGSCVNAFLEMARIDGSSYGEPAMTNPRAVMENPDPEWLPGWNGLDAEKSSPEAKTAAKALALAAVRKSWLERCHSDFAKIEKAMTGLGDKVDEAVKEARKQETPYERIAAILDARKEFQKDSYPYRLRSTGPRVELEALIKKAFADANRTYLYRLGDHDPSNDKLRPLLSNREAEQRLYCYGALKYEGRWKTPDIPKSAPISDEEVAAAVKPVVDRELAEKAARKSDSLIEKTAKRFREREQEIQGVGDAKADNADSETPFRFDNDDGKYELQSIERSGDQAVLKFYYEYEDSFVIRSSCRETDKVDRVRDDGTVEYRTICDHKDIMKQQHVRVTVPKAQLPQDIKFTKEDTLLLYGELISRGKRTLSESPKRLRYDVEVKLQHLSWVKRDGNTVFGPYF